MSVVVIAEVRGGVATPASREAVAAGRLMGQSVSVVVPGHQNGAACGDLAALDVDEVVALEHPALSVYTADGFVAALASFISSRAPAWVVAPHSYQSRDFVPALAARLDRPLITDCSKVVAGPAGPVFTRPMSLGKLSADVVIDSPPGFVTVQAGAFRGDDVPAHPGSAAPVTIVSADVDPSRIRQRPEPPFREVQQAVDLAKAERIVAVVRGIKGPEHLPIAEALAAALGAELAASRPVADAGWLPMDRQIGSSGQTVAPKLYVALGISGAIQHVVGMRGARTIVAVNKDPDAPIFEVADYGIVGDLFEVVPAIIAALKG
jgi:electron transfer flavoprotein alpha subunit